MAKAVEQAPIIVSTSTYKPKTLSDMQAIYQTVHKFEKESGNEKAFFEKFGTEKQWLRRFKRTSVDRKPKEA